MAVITEYFKNLQLPEVIINGGKEGSLHLQMLFTEPVSAASDYSVMIQYDQDKVGKPGGVIKTERNSKSIRGIQILEISPVRLIALATMLMTNSQGMQNLGIEINYYPAHEYVVKKTGNECIITSKGIMVAIRPTAMIRFIDHFLAMMLSY